MIDTEHGAARLEAERPRADAGIVFLVGMVLVGAFTIVATLGFADAPAETGAKPVAVSAR